MRRGDHCHEYTFPARPVGEDERNSRQREGMGQWISRLKLSILEGEPQVEGGLHEIQV